MSLSIGIIGLPNAGKSTLFNALLKQAKAEVANYPFTTIEPNVGIVEVPDSRLEQIANSLQLPKKIPATIKFVDIAGLVKGAHKGEGLGNQFLAHIRECDALVEVVRFFEDSNVAGVVDPQSDIETLKTELILKDLETLEKRIAKIKESIKTLKDTKEIQIEAKILETLKQGLEKEKLACEISLSTFPKEIIFKTLRELQLLTQKPILYVANVSETQLGRELNTIDKNQVIELSAKLEFELTDLDEKEASEYLQSYRLEKSGISTLISKAYQLLNLITFYTLKEDDLQIQAWPTEKGTRAPAAAGTIHSDFEGGFIAAECVNWKDLIESGNWHQAKEKGKIRTEGKDYVVCDGDVIHFKYSV